jgi:hypothetical protein
MALHAQNDDNKSFEALDVLIQACKVDPKNPQVRESKREREGGNLLCCAVLCRAAMFWYCCLPVSSCKAVFVLSSLSCPVLPCLALSCAVLTHAVVICHVLTYILPSAAIQQTLFAFNSLVRDGVPTISDSFDV